VNLGVALAVDLPQCNSCNIEGNTQMTEFRTRLKPPAEAFVRKYAAQRDVSMGAAIDQILAQVVKDGGIDVTDTVSADDAPAVETQSIRAHSDDEGPAI
tara:strand:+ start:361 stop:657 length:297 start_codon:yes stop_codon:yes gene_type:complete